MSVLSIPYLLLSGASSIFIWLFSGHSKKITVFLANAVFLYLLGLRTADAIYVLILTVWTWLFGLHVKKRPLLVLSILIPVLGLCFYKYSNPFTGLWLAMPLGISFYTFKAISYLADRYHGKNRKASLLEVFDYLCFFPVFMAGPINRSEPFFEELNKPMVFQYRDQKNGCILAGLGLFQKLVISSELSRQVTFYLNNADHPELSGWYTLIGVIFYAFYIYADFDSYSNIAIGTARMMGFHLERNFFTPYLSADIREFWRRWHISLSSWLRAGLCLYSAGRKPERKGQKVPQYPDRVCCFRSLAWQYEDVSDLGTGTWNPVCSGRSDLSEETELSGTGQDSAGASEFQSGQYVMDLLPFFFRNRSSFRIPQSCSASGFQPFFCQCRRTRHHAE